MREANDRGYECLILADGTGATDMGNHQSALKMVTMQGGVFGAVGKADAICAYLAALPGSAPSVNVSDAASASTRTLLSVPSAAPSAFSFAAGSTALLMIDWQKDFLDVGGFGHSLGNDVAPLQAALTPAAAVLSAARAAKIPIVHTLEAHHPDMSDCPGSKKRRCPAIGTTLDTARGRVLIAGEPGNAIVDAVAPIAGELLVHKPGKGAFYGTKVRPTHARRTHGHALHRSDSRRAIFGSFMRSSSGAGSPT